jgi:hypothetical protein
MKCLLGIIFLTFSFISLGQQMTKEDIRQAKINQQNLERIRQAEEYSVRLSYWRVEAVAKYIENLNNAVDKIRNQESREYKAAKLELDLMSNYLVLLKQVNTAREKKNYTVLVSANAQISTLKKEYQRRLGKEFPSFMPVYQKPKKR